MADQEEQEPIQLDPRELEALQRASDHALSIDDDSSPEAVAVPELPTAAEQPAPAAVELPLPEIEAPVIDEAIKQLVDELPDLDLPATPPQRPLSAWQKRHGQKPPPAQPLPVPPIPPAAQRPQPEPEKMGREDMKGLLEEARRVGALDEKENVVNWDRMLGQDNGQRIGNADVGQGDKEEAQKEFMDRMNAMAVTTTEILRELSGRIQRIEIEQKRILNGLQRSRG
jgi:hypothetical protein